MKNRNTLRIEGGNLVVVPRGLDKLWGLRKQLVVPLSSISEVRIERAPFGVPTGRRGPGLDGFGKQTGTFHPGSERHYWNYAHPGEALNIRLDGSQYFHQLFLSVSDAEAAQQLVTEAVAGHEHQPS